MYFDYHDLKNLNQEYLNYLGRMKGGGGRIILIKKFLYLDPPPIVVFNLMFSNINF